MTARPRLILVSCSVLPGTAAAVLAAAALAAVGEVVFRRNRTRALFRPEN